MEKFPATLIPIMEIHYSDFEGLVKKAFGFEVTFDYCMKAPRDIGIGFQAGELGYRVDGIVPPGLPAYEERMERIRRGQRSGDIALLLNTLAADGFIHRGRWIIRTGEKVPPKVAEGVHWSGSLINLRVALGTVH